MAEYHVHDLEYHDCEADNAHAHDDHDVEYNVPVTTDYIVKAQRRKISERTHEFIRKNSKEHRKVYEDRTGKRIIVGGEPVFFVHRRHQANTVNDVTIAPSWRGKKTKLKTVGVALVLCLNIGVDPPHVNRNSIEKHTECWIDVKCYSANKAVETVGQRLQVQYERYQPRARFKKAFDPTLEQVRKVCKSLRRGAKKDRLLFHYNGHGVPSPTQNGEIWVFDNSYSKYVPVSLYDIQSWIGGPSIFVFECNYAGLIVKQMEEFRKRREAEYQHRIVEQDLDMPYSSQQHDFIQIAACGSKEHLPSGENLPNDLFTCCLTTPVKAALHWYVSRKNNLNFTVTADMVDNMPGDPKDRQSPLGELNWIFVAITDTIAWLSLSDNPKLFQLLFREDLLVASIMRNYLLAERVMKSFGVTPVSHPKLPTTCTHPLWDLWDTVVDETVWQLETMLNDVSKYERSSFFNDQLTALDIWLGSSIPHTEPPEQLVVLLQLLLNADYRDQTLVLLDQVLALGCWAVKVALEVGFFPILLKLIENRSTKVCPVMTLIWAKIIGVDVTVRVELIKNGAHTYFIDVIEDYYMSPEYVNSSAYILAKIMYEYPAGQKACFKAHLLSVCLDRLHSKDALMRQWCAVCLGLIWTNCDTARGCGVRDGGAEKLIELLKDECVETRAAAVFALGKLLGNEIQRTDTYDISLNNKIAGDLIATYDGSSLVRRELIAALYGMIVQSENIFIKANTVYHMESFRRPLTLKESSSLEMFRSYFRSNNLESKRRNSKRYSICSESGASGIYCNRQSASKIQCDCNAGPGKRCEYLKSTSGTVTATTTVSESVYTKTYELLVDLMEDPDDEVRYMAVKIVSYIYSRFLDFDNFILQQQGRKKSSGEESIGETVEGGDKVLYGRSRGNSRLSSSTTLNSFWEKEADIRGSDVFLNSSPSAASITVTGNSQKMSTSLPNQNMLDTTGKRWGQLKERVRLLSGASSCSTTDFASGNYHSELKQLIAATRFFDWCQHEFLLSMMKNTDYNTRSQIDAREWRTIRNAKVREESKKTISSSSPFFKLEEEVFIKKNMNSPSLLKFDPYVTHLVAADSKEVIVWNYETGRQLNYFDNGNSQMFKISSLHFVNSHDVPLLLLATDEGNIRVWKDYDDTQKLDLVAAWNIIPLNESREQNAILNMLTEWDQHTGSIMATGNVGFVRVWDVEKDLKVGDISTKSEKNVTAIKGSCSTNPLFAVGLENGIIQLIDRRLEPASSCVLQVHEHDSEILDVFLRDRETESIVSADGKGNIKIWDARKTSSVYTIQKDTLLPAVDQHPQCDMFAYGSLANGVKTMNWKGEVISELQYHGGIMGTKIGPIACLAFHPFWPHLALATTDGVVCVYSNQKLVPLGIDDLVCSECG